jgi:transposase
MGPRYRSVDREEGLLLSYDLWNWIPANDIVHFTIEAAEMVPNNRFAITGNGTGDEQYHPMMLLALLLHSYRHGIFSSRRIERATHRDMPFDIFMQIGIQNTTPSEIFGYGKGML